MAINKLVYYIIPLVVLVLIIIWQFGPNGLMEGVKTAVKGVISKVSFGAKTTLASKLILPTEHETAIRNLVSIMGKMRDSSSTNCYMNYKVKGYGHSGMPDLGGTTGTIITLSENKIDLSYNGQVPDSLTKELNPQMKGIKLCVISGKEVSDNFYTNFLNTETASSQNCVSYGKCYSPYYTSVKKIILSGTESISYDSYSNLELEDGGWLYKNDLGEICFFPTQDMFNGDEGLNDDFVFGGGNSQGESIPYKINSGELKLCSSTGDWKKYQSIELAVEDDNSVVGQVITQVCTGLIGKDCLTKYNKPFKELPSEAKSGCWVVATSSSSPTYYGYFWGEAEEGQILYSNKLESPGNLEMVSDSLKLGQNEKIKTVFSDRAWYAFNGHSLVCLNHYWYDCTSNEAGKILNLNNKKYTCTLDNKYPVWKETP